jgi:rubredoxin
MTISRKTGFRGIQNKPYNDGLPVAAPSCPECGADDRQIKIGHHASGSQRYKCRKCGKQYTPKSSGW